MTNLISLHHPTWDVFWLYRSCMLKSSNGRHVMLNGKYWPIFDCLDDVQLILVPYDITFNIGCPIIAMHRQADRWSITKYNVAMNVLNFSVIYFPMWRKRFGRVPNNIRLLPDLLCSDLVGHGLKPIRSILWYCPYVCTVITDWTMIIALFLSANTSLIDRLGGGVGGGTPMPAIDLIWHTHPYKGKTYLVPNITSRKKT